MVLLSNLPGSLPFFLRSILERRYARLLTKRLLRTYYRVILNDEKLSGIALYRQVLLHAKVVAEESVEDFLIRAQQSVDPWTSPGRLRLGLREVIHYLLLTDYIASGRRGSLVAFKDIVDTIIPEQL